MSGSTQSWNLLKYFILSTSIGRKISSLKNLVLLSGAVDPLSLMYKMPNLEKVVLINKLKWNSQVDKAILRNYLPDKCKLVEEKEDKMGLYRFITTRDRRE